MRRANRRLGRSGAETRELQCSARVLRNEVDQARGERGDHELAGAEIERAVHSVAVGFQRLAVHLSEEPAFGEVEGTHRELSRLRTVRSPTADWN